MADIFLQNTMTGKKEKFVPITPGQASVYVCGPTVYGYIHVGNTRPPLTMELLRKVLVKGGYEVHDAANYTDVDDKIIKRANEEGRDSQSVAEEFTKVYDQDIKNLGNDIPKHRPKATEYIPQMLEMIQGLEKKDMAYAAETPYGKDVYFRVRNFKNYGKLSKRNLDDMMAGARIEVGEAKDDPMDFALWKAAKPGEPSWQGPYGAGRPGWHIECSAMIKTLFPNGLDVHMGGLDLIFPHHENEIAQSEALTEKPLAKYWLHNNMLVIGREKMSKSLGNVYTAHRFLEEYGNEVLRLLMYQQHYRSPVDFAEENISRTEALLNRLYQCKLECEKHKNSNDPIPAEFLSLEDDMWKALNDDLNSAKALGFILKAARVCFRENTAGAWRGWAVALQFLQNTFGLLKQDSTTALNNLRSLKLKRFGLSEERANQIDQRLEQRIQLRNDKKFEEADQVRKDLEAEGLLIMDGPDGVAWTVKSKNEDV